MIQLIETSPGKAKTMDSLSKAMGLGYTQMSLTT
jgi:hypothetical protein